MKKITKIICMLFASVFSIGGTTSCNYHSKPSTFIKLNEKEAYVGLNNPKNHDLKSKIKIHFINTEEVVGDCILIQEDNTNILVDFGNPQENTTRKVLKYFEDINLTHIDYAILSHSHYDHVGGAKPIIDKYDVYNLITREPDWSLLGQNETANKSEYYYNRMIEAASHKKNIYGNPLIVTEPQYEGYRIQLTDHSFMKIYGEDHFNHQPITVESLNDINLIVYYECYDFKALITGDASDNCDDVLIDNNIKVDILKMEHHGQGGVHNSERLLDFIQPKVAVATSAMTCQNFNNGYYFDGVQRMKDRNIPMYSNGISGNILATSDGYDFKIKSEYELTPVWEKN